MVGVVSPGVKVCDSFRMPFVFIWYILMVVCVVLDVHIAMGMSAHSPSRAALFFMVMMYSEMVRRLP